MEAKTPALRLPGRFTANPCGLKVSGKPTPHQWEEAGRVLAGVDKCLPWLIGDWILAGEQQWGRTYEEAMEITGLAYGSLMNAASVCRRVEFSRRRENLSFKHHTEVASLDPEQQQELLEAAESGGWTTEIMRAQVRTLKGLPAGEPQAEEDGDVDLIDDTDDPVIGEGTCGLLVEEPDLDEDDGAESAQGIANGKPENETPRYPAWKAFQRYIMNVAGILDGLLPTYGRSIKDMMESQDWDPQRNQMALNYLDESIKALKQMRKEIADAA
jgi:hypothetical protein